jgi:hypothetical protein
MTCDVSSSPVAWKSYQISAAARFVKRCRYQRGGLLVHSMGSGKTLTSLYILSNLGRGHRWLIILPKGLDSEWKKEFFSFIGYCKDFKSGDRCTVKTQEENENRKKLALEMLDNTDFMSYKDISTMLCGEGSSLIDKFRERYVVCDEAHRLLPLLRSQPQQSEEDEDIGSVRPLDRAFAVSKRIFLVTGTPVQRSWGDIALLTNIIAGGLVISPLESAFIQRYAKSTSWLQKGLSFGGFSSNAFLPVLQKVTQLAGASQAVDIFLNAYAPFIASRISGLLTSAGVLSASIASVNPYIQTATIVLGAISVLNTKYNRIVVDGKMVANEISPYVSYYDFASDPDNLASVPEKKIEKIGIPMTTFQIMQMFKLAHDAGTNTMEEFRIVSRIAETDKIGASMRNVDARDDFIRLGRVIGNLSEDNLAYGTRRITKVIENGVSREARPEEKCYAAYSLDPTFQNGKVLEGIFQCPKYLDVFTRLIAIRQTDEYLPVVYSCFDKYGFQTFSAYLTSLGVPHIIIHPQDDVDERSALMVKATSRVPKYVKKNGSVETLSPICVLIHPTLTEGLSFTLNPEIIVLEQPFGYGVQEQIYARVVRTLSKNIVNEYNLTKTHRLQKIVRQYRVSNENIAIPLNNYFGKFGISDFRLTFPTLFVNLSNASPIVLKKIKLNLETAYEDPISSKGEWRKVVGRANPASDDGINRMKKVVDYRISTYYPAINDHFEIPINLSSFWYSFLTEWYNSKSVKDFYTEYLDGYKQNIFETPDELAETTNIAQAAQFSELGAALNEMKDHKVDCAPKNPSIDGIVAAVKYPDAPDIIRDCSLYNPSCSKTAKDCLEQAMDPNNDSS